ncbi:neuromedin U [Pseudomonadota bacterium]
MSRLYSKYLGIVSTILSILLIPTSEGSDLRSAVQNPISSLISLPFEFNFDNGADNGRANFVNIQPVVPVTVGEWNLVNRLIVPVGEVDGPITGLANNPSPIPGDGASGLGDINYSLFFSPVQYKKLIWGIGPSVSAPTASDDQMGTGKWSGGVTAVGLLQPKWGTYGLLFRQLWSFAGDSNRRDVSQAVFQPWVNYNLDKGWFLLSNLLIVANWEADSDNRWTLPLGGGIGRVFKIGNQGINSRLEAYYNIEQPQGAPEWTLRFTWQFLFPRK